MNVKEAASIINKLFDKLNLTEPWNLYHWKIEARSITENIFSKDSHEYKSIGQFYNGETAYYSDAEKDTEKRKEINSLKSLRIVFLNTLNVKGVYKIPKKNKLSDVSEGWLIFWAGVFILGILPATFYSGYWFGERSKERFFKSTSTPSSIPNKITKDSTGKTKDANQNKKVKE